MKNVHAALFRYSKIVLNFCDPLKKVSHTDLEQMITLSDIILLKITINGELSQLGNWFIKHSSYSLAY